MLTDKGEISSSRLINLGGFLVGSTLLLYHGLWLNTLDAEVFGFYLGYCAGVYGAGKLISRKYRSEDVVDSKRLETRSDSTDEYSVSDVVDR